MSLVVGLIVLTREPEVQRAFGDQLMAVSSVSAWISYKPAFTRLGVWLTNGDVWQLMLARSWPLGIAETTSKCLNGCSLLCCSQCKLVKVVAKHLAPSHQERWCLPGDRRVSRIDPWEQVKGKN